MLHVFITFYLEWCNVLMRIYMFFACACSSSLRVEIRSQVVFELRGIEDQALATM
jgi:hypothetical protein